MDVTRRQVLGLGAAMGVIGLMPAAPASARARALAAALPAINQTPFPGSGIPQFIDPLPLLSAAGGTMPTVIAGTEEITLTMREFQTNVAASGTFPTNKPTWVYGYTLDGFDANTYEGPYIAPVIVAQRGIPTSVRWVNDLGDPSKDLKEQQITNPDDYRSLVWLTAGDQTLHWADPLHDEDNVCAHTSLADRPGYCAVPYAGPIPAVPHLHGGEVPPPIDGGPDSWFTPTGGYQGHAYYPGMYPAAGTVEPNEAVYRYPNTQEAAPLWFHDHVLGGTRLNVYAGLAGAYWLYDPDLALPTGLHALGLQQGEGGDVDYLVPLVLQDRSFDTNGQFLIPSVGLNPEHPFWVPEFVGDTIVVNGKAWPYMNVEPRRYRFLIINGANARAFEMFFTNPVTKVNGPTIWQIGTDGGYLDAPAMIDPNAAKPAMTKLTVLPGERADIIVDFSGYEGQSLLLRNTARHPYPKGDSPQGSTIGRVMQFRVGSGATSDVSYDPASGVPLREGREIIRLADPVTGTLAAGVTATVTRQLTLNEVMGPGGPLEVLLNNTKWSGTDRDGWEDIGHDEFVSEIPAEGTTEVWEIVNLTADAHPIHVHLTQVQLVNRQAFNVNKYTKAYAASFASGAFDPAIGPPLNYTTGQPSAGGASLNTRAVGGNPDITPYLQGPVRPPEVNEAGWKDTMRMLPGEVTRFVVRYSPTDDGVASPGPYPFDPNAPLDPDPELSPEDQERHGFVWHCHIIDHEDNEMMRPYYVEPQEGATRTYVQGTDY